MIIREMKWLPLLAILLVCLMKAEAQNSETSYDDNDWIPITPSSVDPADPKKVAQGRVLNLDAPNQKFFPESINYARKRPQPQQPPQSEQFLRETSFQKNTRPQKVFHEPYKFETISQQQLPVLKNQYVQPVQTQFVQQPQFQQFAQPQVVLQQELVAPSQLNQNFYNADTRVPQQQEYSIPFNRSFYQSLNPGAINQEILAAKQLPQTTPRPQHQEEKESVQLLYVPLENLKPNQPLPQPSQTVFQQADYRQEKYLPRIEQHKQIQLDGIEGDFIKQALAAHKLQQQFQLDQQPVVISSTTSTTTTTPKPLKKRKPHQPPLAVYMEKVGPADVKDVLEVLKNAKSIAVQDSIGPQSPNVFVGPSNLDTEGYAKFPLPYLSTVEGNRIERKVDELPFFVAPLSYRTPDGYSKIPLPSPHVGSVVVSNKAGLHHEKVPVARPTQIVPNQISFDSKGNAFLTNSLPNSNQNEYVDYQNQNYQVTSPKEYLTNYQVRPQEQQNEFLPSYELNSNPQFYQNNEQFQSVTPKSQENLFRYTEQPLRESVTQRVQIATEPPTRKPVTLAPQPSLVNYSDEPVRVSTTESALEQNQFKLISNTRPQEYQQNPLQQYELQQINEFIEEGLQPARSTSPPVPATQNYEYASSTQRSQPKIRQRGRKPTTTTTLRPVPSEQTEKYTVLEEFSIKPQAQPPATVKYTTSVETIPAKVYKLSSEQLEPVYAQQTEEPDLKQHVLNQDMLDEQILNARLPQQPQTTFRPSTSTLIYNAPETYRQSEIQRPSLEQNQPQAYQTATRQRPIIQELPQLYKISENQRPLQDQELDQIYKTRTEQQRPIQQEEPQVVYQTSPQPGQQQDSHLAPLVYNRGQSAQEERESEINPFLPGLINSLQDQAVRPLLVPNLLVPTTEKQTTTVLSTSTTQEILTEAPKPESTTKRTRGRQRGNTSRYSTTTSAPRSRNVNANRSRRPAHTRSTTVRITTTVPESYEEATRKTTQQRQRFRTRGRTTTTSATERILTEEAFKQPSLEGGFLASSGNPQSYMQFEHTIENQEVITVKPSQNVDEEAKSNRDYHQVYAIPVQAQLSHEEVSPSAVPVVDVQITHPTTSRTNVQQSAEVIYNSGQRNEEAATKAPVRARGRARIRTRPSSTRATTTSTTPAPARAKETSEEEFFGFIRQPNFGSRPVAASPEPVFASSTPRNVFQQEAEEDQSHVSFVGEIRPKYVASSTTTESVVEPSSEASRFRTRSRVRQPVRQQSTHQSYNEVKDEQVTRRSSVRTRGRGSTHYKVPESVSKTKANDEDDVAGGNYPASFLRARNPEFTTEKPASFQITVDPYGGDSAEDQEPQLSIYRPKILPSPDWVEASILPPLNDLPMEDKAMRVEQSSQEEQTEEVQTEQQEEVTDESEEEIPTTTTAASEEDFETTTRRKQGRRRGVWKLVKQRPIDQFETAESQNYQSVLNNFDGILKEKNAEAQTAAPTTSTEGSLFDTLYNMFGMNDKNEEIKTETNTTSAGSGNEEEVTTTLSPAFPEEYTEQATNEPPNFREEKPEITTNSAEYPTEITTDDDVGKGEIKEEKYEVEPWDMKQVKTSTSTEISHETEICYKGRCVKSKDKAKL